MSVVDEVAEAVKGKGYTPLIDRVDEKISVVVVEVRKEKRDNLPRDYTRCYSKIGFMNVIGELDVYGIKAELYKEGYESMSESTITTTCSVESVVDQVLDLASSTGAQRVEMYIYG